jgi:excisionase family DNA binding protein
VAVVGALLLLMENDGATSSADPAIEPSAKLPRSGADLPPILTVEELAAFLRLNRKTVYEAVSRGEIPGARRIGGTLRISRDAVLVWLDRQSPVGGRRRSAP